MRKKILIRGPILSRSGYGEQARFALRSLRAYEEHIDIYVIAVGWGKTGWLWEDNEERRWIDGIIAKTIAHQQNKGDYDISLQVTIPNEWEKLAPINIGYTAGVETTKVAPQWIEKSYLMDRIILVSNFAKEVYENTSYDATNQETGQVIKDFKCKTPMTAVNYCVRKFEGDPLDLDLDCDFNFFASAQWGPRKNLDNMVKWFVEEFIDQKVGLVLKASWHNDSIMDRHHTTTRLQQLLNEYPNRKCKVHLLHGSMTEKEMHSLYRHPKIKAIISTTHGEGFGLPLFEAAYNGLPVVAPAWSGHCDFLFMPDKDKKTGKEKNKAMFATVAYELSPIQKEAVWDGVLQADSMWCYPNQGSFKMRLREVKKDYGRFKKQAKKLQSHILKNFTQEKMYKQMAEAIVGASLVSMDAKKLPKISILTSVYDGDKFIRPFLEDITRQTIFENKCELILVNPNSPGNEEEVIKEYMEKYPNNIIYKKLDEDPGVYGTWNYALEFATGEYITNANLDDRKAINSLEIHARELYLNKDIDLAYADMKITDKPNETFENNTSNGRKYNFPSFTFENLKMSNMPHASPMWRKSLHDKCGFFEEKYKSAGDWELWLRAASQGSKFQKINDVLGLYFFNPTGISTNPENFGWKRVEEKEIFEKYKDLKREEG